MVGRRAGQAQLFVREDVGGPSPREFAGRATAPDVVLYGGEWGGYARVPATGRGHAAVCHSAGEWARGDDGDGEREVHNNTLEGLWAAPRNFLRPLRGVSKWYLEMYVGIFQWGHTIKAVTGAFIRARLGRRPVTNLGP